MSDYVSIPTIPGALGATYVGDAGDMAVLTVQEARTVLSFQVGILDVASGDVIVELRDQTGGLGQGMQVTIPAGSGSSNVNTSSFTVGTGTVLILRIVQTGAGAGGLYGVVGLNDIGGGATPGVGDDLTTDSIILERDPQAAAVAPSVRDQIRTGVSDRMVRYMARAINRVSLVERHRVSAAGVDLALNEWPATSVVIEEDGNNLVEGTDYEVEADRGLVTRLSGDQPIAWPGRNVKVTYDGGYEFVPPALVDLSTQQCLAEIYKTDQRLFAIASRDSDVGTSFELQPDGWLQGIAQGMQAFKRWRM